VIALGLIKTAMNGGRPTPLVAPPELPKAVVPVSIWILLHAFASGCTAMTGVEAVSNGIRAFREPAVQNARRTLTVIIVTLAVLLAGIALLCHAYRIGATEPGQVGYQSVLSQVTAAVVGRGIAYYVTIGSVICVLALSANTGFADFPRLCRAIAADSYLPHGFAHRGRRLVYSQGIIVLAVLSGALLVLFGGITDRLIPLFAVGAFLAFTMSQAGMVVHWKRTGGPGSRRSMVVNAVGAICTGLTLVVVLVAKFHDGAWITVLIIPALIAIFYWVHRHYDHMMRELASDEPLELGELEPPLVVLLVRGWSAITRKATQLALTISPDVYALHIAADEENAQDLQSRWAHLVKEPAGNAGFAAPRLVVVNSPFRRLYRPLLDFLKELESAHPERQIAVVIPELVERRWFHYFLHNQTATVLKYYLYSSELERVSIVNVPWYLKS
jgi:hypothetical protein